MHGPLSALTLFVGQWNSGAQERGPECKNYQLQHTLTCYPAHLLVYALSVLYPPASLTGTYMHPLNL